MDPATETNNNGKRVRIAPHMVTPAASAIEKAKFTVAVALTLLPPAIKTLAYKNHAKLIKLRIQLGILNQPNQNSTRKTTFPCRLTSSLT
jgi:hypothetical protein